MIRNASNTYLDCIIKSVKPSHVMNESSSNLLNGSWMIQQIGSPAMKLSVEAYMKWSETKVLFSWAHEKQKVTVDYLDFEESGYILGEPEISVEVKGGTDERLYLASFEMAVMPDV